MEEKHWKIYESKIEKRINNLLKNKFYIEIVFLFSNVLEAELKDLINEHQKACKYILGNEGIRFYPKKIFNSDKKTLGELRVYTSSFIRNKNILEEIEKFNKLRVKTIHKLFDQNFGDLEQEIVKFIPRFNKLMENLIDIKIAIITDLQKNIKRKLIYKYKKNRKI